MIRLSVFVLLVVAAAIAYPWAALALVAAGLVGLALSRAWRRPRPTHVVRVEHVSLERRVALRRARDELREIEGGAGL